MFADDIALRGVWRRTWGASFFFSFFRDKKKNILITGKKWMSFSTGWGKKGNLCL